MEKVNEKQLSQERQLRVRAQYIFDATPSFKNSLVPKVWNLMPCQIHRPDRNDNFFIFFGDILRI